MITTHHANKLKTAADQIGVIPVLTLFGNNIHTRIPMSQTLWGMSIDELDLTVRARNGLMRCGANTVGKVSELIMSDHGLGSVRNLGRKSISEIETALLAKGYEQLNAVERLKFWTQLYPMLLCGQPVAGETPWRLVCRPESIEGHDGLYGQKTRSKGSGEYSLSGAVICKSSRRKAGAFAGLGHRFCGLIFVVGRTYSSSFLSWWCRRVKRTVPLTQKGQKP